MNEEATIFLADDLVGIDFTNIPKHIAIIMDGNRRWAKENGLPPMMGHLRGAEIIGNLLKGAGELGVETVTLFAFSTENWARPEAEVNAIMDILEKYLGETKEPMVRDGVRLDTIGDLSRLPPRVLHALQEAKRATQQCEKILLVLALNYGARDEMKRAVKQMLKEKIDPSTVTEQLISNYLDTKQIGDPDLLIRTSGEMRLSNFLLWQISYAEIYSTEVLWPNFSPKELLKAVFDYQRRHRRLGG